MKNWENYIERQKPEYIATPYPPRLNADIILVIPCFNEPGVLEVLKSLRGCARPRVNVLTAIIVNSGEDSDESRVIQNRVTYKEVNDFAVKNFDPAFSFFPFLFENLPRKHRGVGLARKIGMDLAVAHFLANSNSEGIIISLDADCQVSDNFLISIHEAFRQNKKLTATVHNVHHRVQGDAPGVEHAIRQYEAYLHYFRDMLKFTGFPYYYHTIGSAFAVKADAYVRVGGMGRQQGGEDFYFLQKIFASGVVEELINTTVYPLARFSDRVPFGTGPAIEKILDELDRVLKVYSRESFYELKKLFDLKERLYEKDVTEMKSILSGLHPSLISFLENMDFLEALIDCNENSASLKAFVKRFFHHFNAFRVIKYLNSAHPDPFPLERISNASDKF